MPWDCARLKRLIADGLEESLTLEYKRAEAFARTSEAKNEVRKDVSAMLNSAGGVIIYGIAEGTSAADRHLPKGIDPVDRSVFSREWLEDVIDCIQPRPRDIVVHPIPLDTGPRDVAYAVEIPQGTTAYQAPDHKYYKRLNFKVAPMEHHEIVDVMNRRVHPIIEIMFLIDRRPPNVRPGARVFGPPENFLVVSARNTGNVLAKYVIAHIDLPTHVLREWPREKVEKLRGTGEYSYKFPMKNIMRDIVDTDIHPEKIFRAETQRLRPSWFHPILPGLSKHLRDLPVRPDYTAFDFGDDVIDWTVYSDNAGPRSGVTRIKDIEIRPARPDGTRL